MKVEDIDPRSLQCLVAAARHGNFRAAATSLFMSPAAFGKRIAALERQIGENLFERTTRRVFVTPRGAKAVEVAEEFLSECARLTQRFMEQEPVGFTLLLATRFELGLSWITPSLDELQKLRPHRKIHLSFGDSEDMLERLRRSQVDASITSSRRRVRGTAHLELHPEAYVFVGSKALLRNRPLRRAPDARNHILLDIDSNRPLFKYFADTGHTARKWAFRDSQYLGTIASIRYRALRGHGVAVLPLYFVARDLELGELVRILPSQELRSDAFRLVWLAENPKAELIEQLGEDLQKIPLA